MIDLKRIVNELGDAERIVLDAKEGDKDAVKAFYKGVAICRALAEQAREKSEDQMAMQQIIYVACDSLEREVAGG